MPRDEQLLNKNVVITGGGRGIGLEIALACKRAGASVTVMARSSDDLRSAKAQLEQIPSGQALALRGDVTSDEDLKAVFAESVSAHGPLYGLICAASVYGSIGPFSSIDFAKWAETIQINLIGCARSIHHALPLMKAGRIILFSGGGQGPMANFSDYVTSKGAIWRLTETLGAELAPRQIFVNAIAPGAVNTRLLGELLEAGPERVGKEVYQKSLQQKETGGQSPEKASELCLYLLSEKSTGLSGKTISAVWDKFSEFKDLEKMSQSDLLCYRRVVNLDGGTRG